MRLQRGAAHSPRADLARDRLSVEWRASSAGGSTNSRPRRLTRDVVAIGRATTIRTSKAFDRLGPARLQITVAKAATAAGKDFHIDALSGATLTSVGVDNLVRFWMGEQGYKKFLEKLKAGEL